MTEPGTAERGAAGRRLALARQGLDRAAARRQDATWLEAAWRAAETRVLVVVDGRALVTGESRPGLVWVPPAAAPAGERYLLGVDAADVAYFAIAADELPADSAGGRAAGLREVGAVLDDRDAGALVHAAALQRWHRSHRHCARCGAPTEVAEAGHTRRCPACGGEHFPRTDPAVIVLVTDDADRCLLGRQPSWPERRYSVLAGFVEPGESLEQTVMREIGEEVGVRVTDIRYVASQPWPFPASLMLAFTARALDTTLHLDSAEISAAGWYSRDELAAAVAAGTLLLPSEVSIARRLVEDWYGEPFPSDNRW